MSLPVSERAMDLATRISAMMVEEKLDDIRGALAFALAGFIALGGEDEDDDVDHFLKSLASSMSAIASIKDRPDVRGDA